MILFARFQNLSTDEILKKEWNFTDFTYTEMNLILFETIMDDTDKSFSHKKFLLQKTYEEISEEFEQMNILENAKHTSLSCRNLKERKKQKITPKIRETIRRILPYWNDESEKRWLEFAKIQLQYYDIECKLHLT